MLEKFDGFKDSAPGRSGSWRRVSGQREGADWKADAVQAEGKREGGWGPAWTALYTVRKMSLVRSHFSFHFPPYYVSGTL